MKDKDLIKEAIRQEYEERAVKRLIEERSDSKEWQALRNIVLNSKQSEQAPDSSNVISVAFGQYAYTPPEKVDSDFEREAKMAVGWQKGPERFTSKDTPDNLEVIHQTEEGLFQLAGCHEHDGKVLLEVDPGAVEDWQAWSVEVSVNGEMVDAADLVIFKDAHLSVLVDMAPEPLEVILDGEGTTLKIVVTSPVRPK